MEKGEITMEKITKYFTSDYENDTTIEYVNIGAYSMLNCSFTSEDPDYGTDTIHFVAKPAESIEEMAYKRKAEITRYCDRMDLGLYRDVSDNERRIYGDYSNSTLYAIEKALHSIAKDYNPGRWYMTIGDASAMIAETLIKDRTRVFAFCEADREEAKTDPLFHKDNGGWHGIRRIDGFFDNEPDEFIVAVGHYGGGAVGFGYEDREMDMESYVRAVRRAITSATGWDADNMIYVELEPKKEEN